MALTFDKRVVFSSGIIVLTLLYYWLRFATGFVGGFAALQVMFLALGAALGALVLFNKGLLTDGRSGFLNPDFVIFLALMHGIWFLPFLYVRDGLYGAFYSGIGTILPFLLYYYFSRKFNDRAKRKVVFVIELVLFFVAILYIAEFVNNFVLGNGSFQYSIALNEYVINELGGEEGVSSSWVQGDVYALVRLAGPLSHNNTTGLAIALGLVLAFGRIYLMKNKTAVLFFVVFATALFMTGARTSILAGIFGVFCIFVMYHGLKKAAGEILKFFLYMMPVSFLILWVGVDMGIVDMSAFSQLYNYQASAKTIGALAGKVTFAIYGEQITHNPLSLITGLGYPSKDVQMAPLLSSFGDDDVFFMSILSRYGVIIPALFLLLLINAAIATRKHIHRSRLKNGDAVYLLVAPLSCVFAALLSTVHTDAMFRAQIIPVVIILFAFAVDSVRTVRRSKSSTPGLKSCRYTQLIHHENRGSLVHEKKELKGILCLFLKVSAEYRPQQVLVNRKIACQTSCV